MAYIKCSNPANPDPSLIPAERLQTMLDRLQQHWVTHGGFCDECQGTDCSVMKSVLWDVAHWSYEPNITDAIRLPSLCRSQSEVCAPPAIRLEVNARRTETACQGGNKPGVVAKFPRG